MHGGSSNKRTRYQAQDENTAPINEYEQARQERILHNKQVMVDMGLEDAASLLKASIKQRQPRTTTKQRKEQSASRQQLQPTRRSRRLARLPAQEQEHQFEELSFCAGSRQASSSAAQLRRACSSQAMSKLDPSEHHQHNLHRINCMSEKALITRARKITNVGKLRSFVEVLEAAAGMETVLQEAKAALAELTQGGD